MGTFRSLNHRNYRYYFFGQLISLIGSWMQMTVLMWLAQIDSNESRWPAFIAVAQIGPTMFLGAVAGSFADRYPKRTIIVLTQIGFLCCALCLTILSWVNILSVELMVIIMLIHGLFQAIDLPARLSFIPDLVSKEDLPNAVALNSLLFNSARVIGPALGGILLLFQGPTICLLGNSLSYVAVLISLFRMQNIPSPHQKHQKKGGAILGFSILKQQLDLALLMLVALFVAVGGWPLMALLPGFVTKVLELKNSAYSSLVSSVGIGALSAALLVATLTSNKLRNRLIFLGPILTTISLFILSRFTLFPIAILGCMTFGFGMILFFSNTQTQIQLETDDKNRGKVMGIWAMVLSGGVPIGNLIAGPLADIIGIDQVLLIQSSICLLASIVVSIRWFLLKKRIETSNSVIPS